MYQMGYYSTAEHTSGVMANTLTQLYLCYYIIVWYTLSQQVSSQMECQYIGLVRLGRTSSAGYPPGTVSSFGMVGTCSVSSIGYSNQYRFWSILLNGKRDDLDLCVGGMGEGMRMKCDPYQSTCVFRSPAWTQTTVILISSHKHLCPNMDSRLPRNPSTRLALGDL